MLCINPFLDKIELDLIEDNNFEKPKKFIFENKKVKKIRLGRDKNCEIFVNDNSLSRIQFTFNYDKDLKLWKIIDGTVKKASSNGTW